MATRLTRKECYEAKGLKLQAFDLTLKDIKPGIWNVDLLVYNNGPLLVINLMCHLYLTLFTCTKNQNIANLFIVNETILFSYLEKNLLSSIQVKISQVRLL